MNPKLLTLCGKDMRKNISIDISAKTLDICVKENGKNELFKIANTATAVRKFFKPLNKEDNVVSMENTGRYNWNLYEALANFKGNVYVINPLHLKKSIGLVRGKNDRIDAQRIGEFVEKNIKELKVWHPTPKNISKIKVLMTERDSRVLMLKQLSTQKKDYPLMNGFGLDKYLKEANNQLTETVKMQIKEIEKKIAKIISDDEELCKQNKLLQSVPGVGNVLAWKTIASTEGFTLFTDARKFACYSGVVPFDHQSGTSIHWKSRVSPYADKDMKKTLHLAALSVIRLQNDLAQYYQRKVAEGKNKMSVLNAVRNKIVARMFSVIKNQKMYNFNLELS